MKFVMLLIAAFSIMSNLALCDLQIYDEGKEPFYWTGYLGEGSSSSLSINPSHGGGVEGPKIGDKCAEVVYDASTNDAEFYIQVKEGDLNRGPNIGLNLEGAKELKFWARGERSGETVTFGYGYEPDAKYNGYGDSSREYSEVKLTNHWKEYRFDLNGQDLTHINGPFFFKVKRSDNPVGAIFYLDNVTYSSNTVEPLKVTLEDPKKEERVNNPAYVHGYLSRDLNEDEFLWIAVRPLSNVNRWWPQDNEGAIVPQDREFVGNANLGGIKDDKFEIAIIVADKEINEIFLDWVDACKKNESWPSITDGIPETDIKVAKEVIEANRFAKVIVIQNQ